MATLYTVCENNATKSVSINMSVGSDRPPSFYYDAQGCSVEEITKILTFNITSGGPSDENFTIWYNYDVVFRQDGSIIQTSNNLIGSVVMPAGQTSVTKEVLASIDRYCPDDATGGVYTPPAYNEEV